MKTQWLLAAVLPLAGCVTVQPREPELNIPPPPAQVSPNLRQLADRWLNRICAVDMDSLQSELRQRGRPLESFFWRAYESGMSSGQLEELKSHRSILFEERKRWLATSSARVLGAQATARLSSLTEAEFVNAGVEAHQQRYREAALIGLGVICAEGSRPALMGIANRATGPPQSAAPEALRLLESCTN